MAGKKKDAPKPGPAPEVEGAEGAEGADGAPAKKKLAGKTLILFIVLPAILILGGGGAAAFMLLNKPAAEQHAELDEHGKPKKEKKDKHDKKDKKDKKEAGGHGEKGKDGWKLIARFKRPKTDKHLTGFHSFLENFADRNGYLGRRALHGNPWVCDVDGKWHEITEARFTGDGTAGGGHRLDYAGGVEGKGFFLRNGGFFSERVPINQSFKRESTPAAKPVIDFKKLPGL
jgi:hypothetical protein